MKAPEIELARKAAARVGLDAGDARVLRAAENTLVRLPGRIVARIARAGQMASAAKEIRVSRWLATSGVPVVDAIAGIDEPVEIDGRPVTFRRELPPHRPGGPADVADMLRRIHALPPPTSFDLPPIEPFTRLESRITASAFAAADRAWLLAHLQKMWAAYAELPPAAPGAPCSDAWGGNIVVTDAGPVVLDLERFALGPPEWDLVAIAVDHFTFGDFTEEEWRTVCARYGYDVTT